jgi:nitrogen fixation NifU-like protein
MSADDLRALYQDIVLDHSRRPHGRGIEEGWTSRVKEVNPVCGDEIDLAVTLRDGNVANLRWEGHGCAISQASASLVTGLAENTAVEQVRSLVADFRIALRSRGTILLAEERFGDAAALGGVSRYVARVKCAMLPWVALERALDSASAAR